jgi:hypothetical protein
MRRLVAVTLAFGTAAGSLAQAPSPQSGTGRAALAALAPFDGMWRGPATLSQPGGAVRTLIQTERVGPALGGDIRVIEGHSYAPDGSEGGFNAFAIVSAAADGRLEFRSYAQGRAGTFPMTVAPGRFEWSMPAGPGAKVRYVATVSGGTWHEDGWYERDGRQVAKVFEMNLTRVGDTSWPAGGAVPSR